ncbi:olfactory receptor 14J1-like [Ornithorhynchus anatinus]|uniref:olfactory receptor 14J1-like n=1 Tax=Ornithorhynchus anatinus TaxID=9258 RepID=UPI0010A849E0|nr:olfactory receptor 14J1-like [Ornithorhynchus anatinus]
MADRTAAAGFLLLGSSEVREPRPVQAAPFLPVYPAAPAGNLLVVAVAVLDRRLRAPVYFFLGRLSVVDLCHVSVAVPRSVHNALTDNRSVSLPGRVLQVFSLLPFARAELYFLTAGSHDRSVAIRLPLRYEVIVNGGACGKMAAASWLGGGLSALTHTAATFSVPSGGSSVIHRFFCQSPQIGELAHSSGKIQEDAVTSFSALLASARFVSIAVSYARVFRAVLRMPAAQGRAGAFSTCLPRLAVVTVSVSLPQARVGLPLDAGPAGVPVLRRGAPGPRPPHLQPEEPGPEGRSGDLKLISGR